MPKKVSYSELKFTELILYLCSVSKEDEKFGATKLNKLLFYSDFRAFAVRGEPITGADYQKLQHGPAPKQFLPVKKKLERARDATERRERGGQVRLLALRDPNLECFTASDIAIVDEIIRWAERCSGTELSLLSHTHAGWQLTERGETIPYETVFLPQKREPLTEPELDVMDQVAGRISARGIKLPR